MTYDFWLMTYNELLKITSISGPILFIIISTYIANLRILK